MHYADRVQETTTTTTTGTGTITLAGAVSGYRSFSSAFADGDTVRYTIVLGTEWEVGQGVFTASGTTLSRVTVYASSNAGALVNFSAGAKAVWSDIPAATLSALGDGATGAVLYRSGNGHIACSTAFTITDSPGAFTLVADNNSTVARLTNYSTTSVNGANIIFQKARGTSSVPTKALNGDQLGGIGGRGYFEDGTPGFGPATTPSVRLYADEDFTSTANGTYCAITATKKGTTSTGEVWRVDGAGKVTGTGRTMSSGSNGLLTATAAAHTAQTASTELNHILFDLSATTQFATGALTTQRAALIKAPTYGFVGASTITETSTLAIDKAPVAGTNATITRAYSLWVQAGTARLDGGIDAATTLTFKVDTTTQMDMSGTSIRHALPVVGLATAWGSVDGMFVKSMSGSSYDLTSTEYNQKVIKVTGTGANTIRLPPATDAQAYTKYIWNAGSSTLAVKDTNNVAAGATLAAGTGAMFLFSASSVKQLSASFTVA